MAEIQGCEIPEDLYYDVEKNVWVRPETDGTVTIGMTDPAQTYSGRILFVRLKKVGTIIPEGKGLAILESGKWTGPVRTPLTGEIVAVNEALTTEPDLVNIDPYGEAWLVRLQPTKREQEFPLLVTGQVAVEAFRIRVAEEQIQCMRCTD